MEQYAFYKELYFKENDRRQDVLNSLNIPIAIITALSSVIFFVLTNFDNKIGIRINYVFYTMVGASCFCISIAIYYLIRAFSNFAKGYEYSGIPYPQELHDWNNDLIEYYKNNDGTEEDAAKYFEDYLVENFVKQTNYNMDVNDTKLAYIYNSKKFLIMGLVLTLGIMVPYFYNHFTKKENNRKIEIIHDDTNRIL